MPDRVDKADEEWRALMATNVDAPFALCRAVLPAMKARRDGVIINLCSLASDLGRPNVVPYATSKGAIRMLTRALAVEVAPFGIRVNGMAPGNVAAGSSLKVYESDPVYRAWVDRVSPLGKRNSPEAIADAFLYLCSDLAAEMDGHVLQVDMGVGLPKLG